MQLSWFFLLANNFCGSKFVPYYPRSTVTLQRSAACCFLSSNFINPWWYHLWDIAGTNTPLLHHHHHLQGSKAPPPSKFMIINFQKLNDPHERTPVSHCLPKKRYQRKKKKACEFVFLLLKLELPTAEWNRRDIWTCIDIAQMSAGCLA